jgi:hypothetical protein
LLLAQLSRGRRRLLRWKRLVVSLPARRFVGRAAHSAGPLSLPHAVALSLAQARKDIPRSVLRDLEACQSRLPVRSQADHGGLDMHDQVNHAVPGSS